ncbi:MAG: cupin domain-containing protein [Syntrophomonas sp.]
MDSVSQPVLNVIEVEEYSDSTLKNEDIVGHIFNSCEGNQLAHWICLKDIISEEHSHDFDEYFAVLKGRYIINIDGKEILLNTGDEFFIPANTPHSGKMLSGTSIFHVFGGHRPPGVP